MKKLADNANIDIFDFVSVKPLIQDAERRMAKFVKDRPGISLYRLFRTAATKQSLFTAALEDRQLRLDLDQR